MDINWFPGHMAKTLREMRERLGQIDVVIETADARLPESSRNPEIRKLIQGKASVLVLTKPDLADPAVTSEWLSHYREQGRSALTINLLEDRRGLADLNAQVEELARPVIERWERKGIQNRRIRVMVVGIPNTGKSTLINVLAKRQAAKTENRPGVTRALKYITTDNGWQLMDVPGVLWPKLANDHQKVALAASGAIKDTVVDVEELAYHTFLEILKRYPELLKERYKITDGDVADTEFDRYGLFEIAARKRGCVMSGGRTDMKRFADIVLNELRLGIIGRISFERPGDFNRGSRETGYHGHE